MSDSVNADEENWTLVIQPKRKWLDIDLRESIRYRDLIWLFVKRDFVTVYKQTILGPLWFVLNPMLWGYFTACLNSAADTFSGNAGLFSKAYFPRLTAPISKVFSNLFSAGIQLATLMAFYIYYAALGTGFGMVVSALTTKYWDLRQLIGFGIGLWMYATPIVYPLTQVP